MYSSFNSITQMKLLIVLVKKVLVLLNTGVMMEFDCRNKLHFTIYSPPKKIFLIPIIFLQYSIFFVRVFNAINAEETSKTRLNLFSIS